MKKAILKRTADILEKLAVGSSMLVGLFQGRLAGIFIGMLCTAMSYGFTTWEARQ